MNEFKIHLYTFCYNEEFLAPYFLRHYLPIVSKIIVFDNYSSDRSPEILSSSEKVFIKQIDTSDKFRDDVKAHLSNTMWKKSVGHADFVIVCDFDEFLYHPDLTQELRGLKANQFSIVKCQGYDMISLEPPSGEGQLYQEMKEGTRNPEWDKMILFDPNLLTETNFSPGAHLAIPEGQVKILKHDHQFKLLHFRYLGLDYLLKKHKARASRLSDINLERGWGRHYLVDETVQRKIFEEAYRRRERLF